MLLFASVAEAVGTRRLSVAGEPGDNVGRIRDRLVADYPQLSRFVPNLVYAVNEEYAGEDTPVGPGSTLALIPPVSGGC